METTTRPLISMADCPSAAFALKYCNADHHDLTCEVEDRMHGELLHGVLYDPASGALRIYGERQACVSYPPTVDAEGPIARNVTSRGDAQRFTSTAEGGQITVREEYDLSETFKPNASAQDVAGMRSEVVARAIMLVQQSRWAGLNEIVDSLAADIALRQAVIDICDGLAPHGFSAELDILGEEIVFLDPQGECVGIDELPPEVRAVVDAIAARASGD